MLILDQLRRNDPPLRALSVLVLVAMAALLAGLWYVQIVSSRRYQASLETQSFRTVRMPAIRGKIYDRNGIALADNKPSYVVNLYLEDLRDEFQQHYRVVRNALPSGTRLSTREFFELGRKSRYQVASNIVNGISHVLDTPVELTPATFNKHYDQTKSLPISLVDDLTPQQVALYWERHSTLPGLGLDVQPARLYPFGSTAAHVLGYLQRSDTSDNDLQTSFHYRLPDYQGAVGIEGAFDDDLRGQAGVKSMLVNNLGYRQSETVWAPSEPGDNIQLTLDVGLQMVAEKALRNVYGPDRTRGAVVVMDPHSGDILAMASSPTFNPNQFPGISRSDYARLNSDELKAFFNRASQSYVAPGSIFKIVTALACLEAGAIDPGEKMYNPGFFRVGNAAPIKDTASPGEYDFERAFKKSSNTYFISHGLAIGGSKIIDMGHRFFLGQPTRLPTLQDGRGSFPTEADLKRGWFDGDTANLCIGQGKIAVSPVQMAVMTSAIVNGGTVYWPRLVQMMEPLDPASPRESRSFERARVRGELRVQPKNLQIIRSAMIADVESSEGTGKEAAVTGLSIGGKTGTAEVQRGRAVVDHITWFVSYASLTPQSSPKYVVVVMVESGASGGKTCAPVARKIYQEIHRREAAAAARATSLALAN